MVPKIVPKSVDPDNSKVDDRLNPFARYGPLRSGNAAVVHGLRKKSACVRAA